MSDYYYDAKAAAMATLFFEKFLRHVEGEWAGQPFRLLEWQRDLVATLFGWKRAADGTRRYRRCYVEVPRKNGKTALAAGIALYLLIMDNEPRGQVYSAAADKDQARLVFDAAKAMLEQSPQLAPHCRVYRNSIAVPKTGSFYKVLSADAYTKHGLGAHGIIFDELHAQPNRELWDVLNTSTGARRQPLTFAITTAGHDQESICYEQHEYAQRVKDGVIDDPAFLPVLYGATADEDWTDPAVWAKANPSLGQTIKAEYLAAECKRAQETPAAENTFRQLHLDQWTQQETRWLSLQSWDKCLGEVDADALKGAQCYGGLDLSTTTDLSAFALVFPGEGGGYKVMNWHWIPGDNMRERERRDRVPYETWVRQGWIGATPGNVIDYEHIEARIVELADRYDIRQIAYDPWNATALVLRLQERGMDMVPVRQGYASLSAPSKAFERAVLDGALVHPANPVLRWMVDNVSVTSDPAGNIKPVKPDRGRSSKRIDGVIATIMALDCAERSGNQASVYAERGILTL